MDYLISNILPSGPIDKMWKTLRSRVAKSSKPKQKVTEEEVVNAFRSSDKPRNKPKQRPNEYKDNNEMKDVLDLFNKLEGLIVEGDVRVKEVLGQR